MKKPLCNSFNTETGGRGTKIRFFQQASNTFARDCSQKVAHRQATYEIKLVNLDSKILVYAE